MSEMNDAVAVETPVETVEPNYTDSDLADLGLTPEAKPEPEAKPKKAKKKKAKKETPAVAEKPKKKKAKKTEEKKGRGRPKFGSEIRKPLLSYIKKHGLSNGVKLLEDEKGIKASMTLALAVAKENGLTFSKGRPKNDSVRKVVLSYIKKHGLTHGVRLLAEEKDVKVSMTLALAVAKENGLTFPKGRPATKEAA